MSQIQRMNIQAQIDSLPRLPADLRAAMAKPIAKLKQVMDSENDSSIWSRKLIEALNEVDRAAIGVRDQRLYAKFPELKDSKRKWTHEESLADRQITGDINASQLEAKWKDSPNWKRVERVYGEVREQILQVVNDLPISDVEKQKRIAVLQSVQLTLPYSDGTRYGASPNCGSTEENAYYNPAYNKFTVCAGIFNSIQSEDGLRATIAHELAHAIDPNNQGTREAKQTPFAKALSPLIGSKGAAIDCDKWKKLINDLMAKGYTFQEKDPFVQLESCLADLPSSADMTSEKIDPLIGKSVATQIADSADQHVFLLIAQPTTNEDGKVSKNEFYMRPDLATQRGNSLPTELRKTPNNYEIFAQALSCQKANFAGKEFGDLTGADRKTAFERAIAEVKTVLKAKLTEQLESCELHCDDLRQINLGASVGEDFADWIANRVLTLELKKTQSVDERRKKLALAGVFFCDKPNIMSEAHDLAEIEKKHSFRVHNTNLLRQVNFFGGANFKLADCQMERGDLGSCKP